MLRFEYSRNFELTDSETKVIIEDTDHDTIDNIFDIFIKFLRATGVNNVVILNNLISAYDRVKDEIKEDYIMTEDDTEEE